MSSQPLGKMARINASMCKSFLRQPASTTISQLDTAMAATQPHGSIRSTSLISICISDS